MNSITIARPTRVAGRPDLALDPDEAMEAVNRDPLWLRSSFDDPQPGEPGIAVIHRLPSASTIRHRIGSHPPDIQGDAGRRQGLADDRANDIQAYYTAIRPATASIAGTLFQGLSCHSDAPAAHWLWNQGRKISRALPADGRPRCSRQTSIPPPGLARHLHRPCHRPCRRRDRGDRGRRRSCMA